MGKQAHYAVFGSDGVIFGIVSQPLRVKAPKSSIRITAPVDDARYYVDVATKTLHAKRELNAQPVVNGLSVTINGLPAGIWVMTNGQQATTDGGSLFIQYDLPGTYAIYLRGHPHLIDTTLEVTLGDP
ncbi:hypothetical protein [Halomonas sp. Cn5-12]|uniref:hypothetical protein n=1 Tax=Halomonas sp. Cn5-12 TaxID=2908885 RepID=UPI001F1BEBD4|nr:hypothetical protein [Halomonas sp. Cn5-12]MCF2913380.1 hypothetical protein [Halomonas sp. Cn5-12]